MGSNVRDPQHIEEVALPGEPTSVAIKGNYALVVVNISPDYVNTSGLLLTFDKTRKQEPIFYHLGGQPDSIAVSPDGNYAVIAIENERNEDLGDGGLPQLPAGFVVVMDVSNSDPGSWKMSNVPLIDLEGVDYESDPEPEFVAINEHNIAVITLQENNAIVLIDLESKKVINSFSAGTVDLSDI